MVKEITMPNQIGWRYCKKCQALFYSGFSSLGSCSTGGQHDPKGSWFYTLKYDELQNGQRGWKHCNKCHTLNYSGSSLGVCAGGGQHDYANSFEYSLAANVVGAGQNNWRYCKKCQGLAFSGFGTGVCSAGGSHDFTGSWDYRLDVTEPFTSKITAIMQENAPDGFRFVVCDDQNILGSGVGGFSRMAVDPPATPAKLEDRLNIASMSKTLTAAAVLSTLQAKNLSPDVHIAPFLPPDWTLHAQVKKLTFRDFLTHRTGFNEATDRSDYAGIQQSMKQGPPNPIQANYEYRNINFATMRLALPYLNSYNRFTKKVMLQAGSQPAETLAKAYISIVNQRVLAPSNVAPAGCDSKTLKQPPPQPNLPVLLYEYQQPTKPGIDLGDSTLICGASGWSLSVVDYAQFLQTLFFTEIIISEKNRALMMAVGVADGHGLGMNRDAPLAGSDVYSHGAWIPVGNAQVAGWFLYFQASKLIVVALSNAGHNPGVANWAERVGQSYREVYG
jgi:CubicO group peptidase (beta-lactamase class C family)